MLFSCYYAEKCTSKLLVYR